MDQEERISLAPPGSANANYTEYLCIIKDEIDSIIYLWYDRIIDNGAFP